MSTFLTILDYLGALLLLAGSMFLLIGSIGLVRLNDLYSRMHAASKPQWLGVFLLATGAAVSMRTWPWLATALLVVLLQTLSSPVGAHMMARSAYRTGEYDAEGLVEDDLARDMAAREQRRVAKPSGGKIVRVSKEDDKKPPSTNPQAVRDTQDSDDAEATT